MSNFTYIHLHSDLSNGVTNIDSITKYDDYIQRAKELGMKAMAFTEHGSVFSWVNKKSHIEAAGMKYIHGAEFYVTESLDEKIRDNHHCCLYAKNYDGVLELNALSTISFNRKDGHFYYVPRITIDELIGTSENIIVSTACLGGVLHNGSAIVKDKFITFLATHKDRCFLEIQHHNDEEQKKYNQYLYELSKNIELPLIAGTDTHALNDEHMEGRKILQLSKNVRFADEDSWDLTFKSYDELILAYEKQKSLPMDVVKEAIENTNRLADMVEEFKLDKTYKYPHLWKDSEKTFQEKIQEGIKRRGVDKYPNYQEYLDRIEHELEAYRHNGAIDFMLLMEDIIHWCVENDILVGYGRGSVNGSVIAWLLGITEMDSIKHKLNFERFMNVERVSLSDIDTDFPPSRIDDVKKYIFSKTGLYCCDIVTFNTIALKGAIRDVGRALNIPLDIVGNICDMVETDEASLRKQYKELFKYVDLVNGTVVSVGSHPCGCVVAPYSVSDRLGTFTTSTSEYPISQIYMKEVDGLNYVKLDLLRLDTIELINEVCKLAGIERLTPDNIDITDVNVWNSMRDDTTQIFQWEGKTGDDYIKKLLSDENIKKFQEVDENVDRMTLLSIGNSAIRPAGASYRDDLANGVVRKSGSKAIDDFLKPTFGYLVFQCQIIDFLHQYCGFTMGEADIVRRHFAKKQFTPDGIAMTELDIPVIKDGGYMKNPDGTEKKDHHIKGFIATMKDEYNMTTEEAEETIVTFLQVIVDASRYLFSLNHSQPYSYEGYASGWLRYYYPLEFLTISMNINKDKEEKTIALTKYAKKIGIEIKSPKFRHSKATYFCDKERGCIYKGIGSVKYMNDNVANELYELRDKKFNSFLDLLIEMKNNTILNSRQLDILIKIDFFAEFGDINELLYYTKMFNELSGKTQIKKDKIEELGLTEDILRSFSEEETDTRIDEIDCLKFVKSLGYDEDTAKQQLEDCIKFKYEKQAIMTPEVKELLDYAASLPENSDDLLDVKTNIEEIAQYDEIKTPNEYSTSKVIKKFSPTNEQIKEFATKTVIGKFSKIRTYELIYYLTHNSEIEKCSISDRIQYQTEHLGYVDYINPEYDWRYVVVTGLNAKYSPKFNAYSISNGKSVEMKVSKRKNRNDSRLKTTFSDLPFENGEVLYIKDVKKQPKQQKVDDEWVTVPGVFEWWIKDYTKVR